MFSIIKDYWKELNKKIFKINETGIETIDDFNLVIDKCLEEHIKIGEDLKIVFRGESKLYPTPVSPNIARLKKDFIPYKENYHITEVKIQYIRNFQNTQKGNEFSKRLEKDHINWLYLTQHYTSSTRLLDVTEDRMVALYFTCEKNNKDNGFVYMVLVRGLKPSSRSVDSFLEIFEKQEGIKFDYNIPQLLNFENKNLDDQMYIRLRNQRANFIWWQPLMGNINISKFFPVLINHIFKDSLLNELETTFNINNEFLFPD